METAVDSSHEIASSAGMTRLARPRRWAGCLCLFLAWPLYLHAETSPPPDAMTVDGGRYYGPLVDGKLHGHGRIEWENGTRHEGEFANGLYSGQGRLQSASGLIYEGEFRNGLIEGRGRMQMPEGALYVGEFRDGSFHGEGRYETPDGEVYEGRFENGNYHGQGRLTTPNARFEGEFRHGRPWGQGAATYDDGRKYRGDFVRGRFHGKGRFENADGEVYDGDFDNDDFTGTGTLTRQDGSRYEGGFLKWRLHGSGVYVDAKGNVYEGQFANGEMVGAGRLARKSGEVYAGDFKQWRFHGQGVLRLANGDEYQGGFAGGFYEGEGTLTYARPQADGRRRDSGIWRYGSLANDPEQKQEQINVETALYNQRRLLDRALASLTARDPKKINLYLLAVAGDGSQEVFRREVDFVRKQFARRFGTKGHSIGLINSRKTVAASPMATITSIRDSLTGIAARMDRERDILFLFLTSHGSREHEFALNQNSMNLRNLPARELGEMLKASGIRWKVVVVSACYGGGFIDAIKDDHTLIITAARHDRQSFGCADENDFTYFGRAFFKEALPQSNSFQSAFRKADSLIKEWEARDLKAEEATAADRLSLPQIVNPAPIDNHLRRWWSQLPAERASQRLAVSPTGTRKKNMGDKKAAMMRSKVRADNVLAAPSPRS